jgi:cobalt-zinc-cadmium efflux system membrane fusion protein
MSKHRPPVASVVSGVLLLAWGCRGNHPHPGGGEHGHGGAAPADEIPGQSVTIWAERTELFMEHKALIAGKEVAFAAHVTRLATFKPVTAGTVTLTIKMATGASATGRADKPTNPGIFRPVVRPPSAGQCEMSFAIDGAELTDRFTVGPCQVFPDVAAAVAALGKEEPQGGKVPFLKEQQWKTDFATAPVGEQLLQPSLAVNGEIVPVAGKEARLAAAVAGRVGFSSTAPVLGMDVRKGQLLAVVAPRLSAGGDRSSLEADLQSARAELTAAEAQLARARRLVAEQAIAERTLEEAQARATVARARLGAATGRLRQYSSGSSGIGAAGPGGFQVRSPIDGTLVAVHVASGETVEEGKPLFTVIDMRRVWLEARVFEPDIPRIEGAKSAWFTLEGYQQPFVVDGRNGRLITVGRVIDPQTRTVPVLYEIDNGQGKLRVGQFAKVKIATGDPIKTVAVPASAVLEEAGRSVAYVQVEGEAFEQRQLTLGIAARGWVAVTDGVRAGEHIVTRGAYDIKLASASGVIPAHGHVH